MVKPMDWITWDGPPRADEDAGAFDAHDPDRGPPRPSRLAGDVHHAPREGRAARRAQVGRGGAGGADRDHDVARHGHRARAEPVGRQVQVAARERQRRHDARDQDEEDAADDQRGGELPEEAGEHVPRERARAVEREPGRERQEPGGGRDDPEDAGDAEAGQQERLGREEQDADPDQQQREAVGEVRGDGDHPDEQQRADADDRRDADALNTVMPTHSITSAPARP
jgi:hypothetical protein